MARTKQKETPGQTLWLSLYQAESYDEEAKSLTVPPGSSRHSPERATKKWLEGVARHMKKSFPARLRKAREKLGTTQQELADIAQLTATAVAMIERSERAPSLDTAAKLCWALDVAAEVKLEDIT